MTEQIKKNAVVVNSFVRRQTKESPYSHATVEFEDVAGYAETALSLFPNQVKQGYKPGVLLIDLPLELAKDFVSSVVKIDDNTKFVTTFEARRPEEEKHINVRAYGPKVPAKKVELVLYRRDVLEPHERGGPVDLDVYPPMDEASNPDVEHVFAEYELIAILAHPTEQEAPMDPVTMARNFLQKPGGTSGTFTAKQFAESIWFWSQHSMAAGEEK